MYIEQIAAKYKYEVFKATLKLLILCSILIKIVISSNLILGVNTDATFCLAFIGYLYIGEISYTNK